MDACNTALEREQTEKAMMRIFTDAHGKLEQDWSTTPHPLPHLSAGGMQGPDGDGMSGGGGGGATPYYDTYGEAITDANPDDFAVLDAALR